MASLRILVPDGTTNYVKNPSFRYDTTGYTSIGSTLTRSNDRARFGFFSMKVVTNGSVNNEGFYYRLTWLTGIQSDITASVYLRGSGKVRLRLIDNNAGMTYLSKNVVLTDTRWTRLDVSGHCSGGNDVRIAVETSDLSPKAITFYADGVQLEPKAYLTTYCDGDQPDCTWNVLQHGSISTRSAYTRTGGRFIELAGCERPEQNLYMTVLTGLGVAPMRNNIQSYSDSPGSYHQNIKVLNRALTIAFYAKSPDLRGDKEKSLRDLHDLRQTLFNIIQPDKTAGSQEFVLEYNDGDYPLYLGVRYESGLEGEWDVRNRWVQSFPVRFLVCSPFFYDDNQEVNELFYKDTATVNYIAQRINGTWSEMNGGLSSFVRQFAIGLHGEIIAVGEMLKANNKIGATDPQITVNYVSYWDGTQWQKMGTGANGIIYSVAVAPNGDVYVTGNFTSIGGVACNYVARWDYVAKTWNALGTGLSAAGYAIDISSSGMVYVGGGFLTAGGVSVRYVARYDGTWHSMGAQPGLNAAVYSIDISPDGNQVYLGGLFTDEYGSPGTPLNYVALYEPFYNTFSVLGDGFDSYVTRVFLAPSGRLYAVGNFTTSGSQDMLYISYWNGMAWYAMESGANSRINDIHVDQEGSVVVAGAFGGLGSAVAAGIGAWNGSSWVALDISPSGNGSAIIRDRYDNIYHSFNGTLANYARISTIQNVGTAEVPASFYLTGPATLYWIENQTAQKRIYLNLSILSGEEIFINTATGEIKSSVRGDVSYAIFPGSDLRAWKLLPGENKISCMMLNDTQASMRIAYSPRFWSADSTVRQVAL